MTEPTLAGPPSRWEALHVVGRGHPRTHVLSGDHHGATARLGELSPRQSHPCSRSPRVSLLMHSAPESPTRAEMVAESSPHR